MNTLYKVWGIITYVFTGFYAVGWLLVFIFLGIGVSEAKSAMPQYAYYMWRAMSGEFSQARGIFVLIVVLLALVVLIGFIIRILAGAYLFKTSVHSKVALLTVAVFYFIISILNLAFALLWGEAGSVGFTLFFLFCMGWAIATGVFLILKQRTGVVNDAGFYDGASYDGGVSYIPVPYTPNGDGERSRSRGCIEGLFGDYIGKKYVLRPGESCRIGRDSGCEIQILHRKVSRIHCSVKFLPDGRFEALDTSYNGTFYENAALPNGVATIVEAGGKLVIGNADNVLSLHIE